METIKPINLEKFITDCGELIYCKHCNFNEAILWYTKELSLPLTIFEDIKKRGVKKIRFVNTNPVGEMKGVVWDFDFDMLDRIKNEVKRHQETQYYFSIKDKLPSNKTK